ncbi:hypothetical protein [Streptomyces sp. NPDC018693]|uniref:hypothetical protein n=1 Tax=unclassified Streptomyces TaxID=2593676 RepID=UPI003799AD13
MTMNEYELARHLDGRARVEVDVHRRFGVVRSGKVSDRFRPVAHALGYRLLRCVAVGKGGPDRYIFERDDEPQARRRAELSIARLRAGGPLLPAMEPPPPPPPGPPPPAPGRR